MNFLIIHELTHFLGGSAVGYFYYRKTKNIRYIILAIFCSIFIDADHLIDLVIGISKTGFLSLNKIIIGDYFRLSGKVYLFLHDYELVLLLITLSFLIKRWQIVLRIIAFSFLVHILIDQFTYRFPLDWYFFTARYLNNFSIRGLNK